MITYRLENILLLLSSIKYIQVNFTNTPVLLSIVINFKPQFAHLFFKRKYTEQQIYNRLCKNRFQDYMYLVPTYYRDKK